MREILLILSFACYISCTSDIDMIDLSNVDKVRTRVTANDVYASVDFVPLETTEECILCNPSVFAVDDSSVFIWDGDDVYRFSTEGKYCNRVGRFGHGYSEHGRLNSANYDRKRKVILLGTPDGTIYKYGYDGTFIDKIKLTFGNELLQTVRWSDSLDCMVCEIREYSKRGLKVWLSLVSQVGKKLNSYEIYSDEDNFDLDMLKTGMLRNSGNGVYFKLPFSDSLYYLSSTGISIPLILYQGASSPDRRDVEDMDYRKKGKKVTQQINNMVITNNYIYLSIDKGYQSYDVIIRKDSHTIIHCSEVENNVYRHLDIRGMKSVTFWPWIADSGVCVDIIPTDDFCIEDIKAIGCDTSNLVGTELERNPILVIAHESQ